MNRIYQLLFAFVVLGASAAHADSFTIVTSGSTYSPASLSVNIGDEITIAASGTHPLQQVEEATWNANMATPMGGGFTSTSDHTFTATTPGVIYYVCTNHVGNGMKGMITVSVATGIEDAAAITSLKIFPTIVMDGSFSVSAKSALPTGTILELYSTKGDLVKTFAIKSDGAVLVADVATGTYTAVIRVNDNPLLRERMIFVAD